MIFDTKPRNWKELQNFVWQMFLECGFEIEISKTVKLVRGQKEIDVYAQDKKSEYSPIILVECKYREKPVNQEVIHSFRTVISDFWANLWFIVSKKWFQSGSYEAAENTNIKLVSLKELESEYYFKRKQNMVKKYMKYADRLFSYRDPSGKTIMLSEEERRTLNLVYSAYQPICSLWPMDQYDIPGKFDGFQRKYPLIIPIIDDHLEQIWQKTILNDRQYFDFIEENKDKSLNHFEILFKILFNWK